MENHSLKEGLSSMSLGYADHKIICDDQGIPCDYEFIDMNKVCESITGLTSSEVAGKRISEVLPNLLEDKDFDWVGTFGEVALSNSVKEFDQYSKPLGKYFRVKAFSLKAGEFITVLNDITENVQDRIKFDDEIMKYKTYIENAPYALFEFDEKGNILDVNSEAEIVTGYSLNELKSMSLLDMVSKEKFKKFSPLIQKLHEGVMQFISFDFIKKDGTIRYGNCRAVKLDKNKFLAFAIDSTEFRDSKTRAFEASEKYQQLFDNMYSGCGIYQVLNDGKYGKDYIIRDFNKESLRIEKKTKNEVVGKSLYDLRPNIDEYGLIDVFRNVWKTGKANEFPSKVYIDENYNNYYKNNVFKLDSNEIVAIYSDITEVMMAQEDLKKSRDELTQYIEKAPYGIMLINGRGEFLDANIEALTMTGYTMEELRNLSVDEITASNNTVKANNSLRHLREDGHFELDKNYIIKGGSIRTWHVRSVKIAEDRYLGFLHDVTDIRKIEKEKDAANFMLRNQQKLKSVGTLASGIAHEINNPINGIMNYSQLILDSEGTEKEVDEYAKEILSETQRISDIVKDLLLYSRQEKQSYSLADIRDIVNHTTSLVKTIIKNDQIRLNINIPQNLPKIRCRSQQIQQVIMNLLTNARDALNKRYKGFDEDKYINLSISEITLNEKNYIRLVVEDHGDGIPKEAQDKLFDPFFTTKSRDKGTGLGLAISYSIVLEHKGNLTFDTKQGKYTKFKLDLPTSD